MRLDWIRGRVEEHSEKIRLADSKQSRNFSRRAFTVTANPEPQTKGIAASLERPSDSFSKFPRGTKGPPIPSEIPGMQRGRLLIDLGDKRSILVNYPARPFIDFDQTGRKNEQTGEIVLPYYGQDNSRYYPDGPGFNEKELGQDPLYAWSYHPPHSEQLGEAVKRGLVRAMIANQVHFGKKSFSRRGAWKKHQRF